MQAPRTLRWARRRAGLTQRDLASATGIAQPTIARIESGTTVPRLDTFQRLLEATGNGLSTEARTSSAVERTLVAGLLAMSPRQRVASLSAEARFLDRLDAATRIETKP